MCTTCGCQGHHGHHHHDNGDGEETVIRLEEDILGENNRLAAANRSRFAALGVSAVNIVSSPGSGKTTLLEATIRSLAGRRPVAVIEGDQHTDNDARRITSLGVPAVQINTRNGCHLDAHMIAHAADDLAPQSGSLLLIENVGNLVCPALFDLGEVARVVVISVTEGDDKPLKYPYMFAGSQICVINKIDLLPYVDSDLGRVRSNALRVNPSLRFFEVSATRGDGITGWTRWLAELTD